VIVAHFQRHLLLETPGLEGAPRLSSSSSPSGTLHIGSIICIGGIILIGSIVRIVRIGGIGGIGGIIRVGSILRIGGIIRNGGRLCGRGRRNNGSGVRTRDVLRNGGGLCIRSTLCTRRTSCPRSLFGLWRLLSARSPIGSTSVGYVGHLYRPYSNSLECERNDTWCDNTFTAVSLRAT
jgi:hypothetical protein